MLTFYILMSLVASVHEIGSVKPFVTGEGKALAFYTSQSDCETAKKALDKGLSTGEMAVCVKYERRKDL